MSEHFTIRREPLSQASKQTSKQTSEEAKKRKKRNRRVPGRRPGARSFYICETQGHARARSDSVGGAEEEASERASERSTERCVRHERVVFFLFFFLFLLFSRCSAFAPLLLHLP